MKISQLRKNQVQEVKSPHRKRNNQDFSAIRQFRKKNKLKPEIRN